MLPQELLLLSQDDVIVLRAGIPPLKGGKIRYYKDKWMAKASSVVPPPIAAARSFDRQALAGDY